MFEIRFAGMFHVNVQRVPSEEATPDFPGSLSQDPSWLSEILKELTTLVAGRVEFTLCCNVFGKETT